MLDMADELGDLVAFHGLLRGDLLALAVEAADEPDLGQQVLHGVGREVEHAVFLSDLGGEHGFSLVLRAPMIKGAVGFAHHAGIIAAGISRLPTRAARAGPGVAPRPRASRQRGPAPSPPLPLARRSRRIRWSISAHCAAGWRGSSRSPGPGAGARRRGR